MFNFLDCTDCKQKITAPHCPLLHNELTEVIKIEEDVKKKSLDRAKHEEIHKLEQFTDPKSPYYNDLQKYAMFKLAYYQCFKCKAPYFGGLKDCIQA